MEKQTELDAQTAPEVKQLKADDSNKQTDDLNIQSDTLQTPASQVTGIR